MKINLSTTLLWSHAVSCVDGFSPILPSLRRNNNHVSLRMASAAGSQHQEVVTSGGAKQAPSVDDPK